VHKVPQVLWGCSQSCLLTSPVSVTPDFFLVLEFEHRTYTLSHSTSPFFIISFFEIGSCELFAQADFEL
jgi:hypothetical protein